MASAGVSAPAEAAPRTRDTSRRTRREHLLYLLPRSRSLAAVSSCGCLELAHPRDRISPYLRAPGPPPPFLARFTRTSIRPSRSSRAHRAWSRWMFANKCRRRVANFAARYGTRSTSTRDLSVTSMVTDNALLSRERLGLREVSMTCSVRAEIRSVTRRSRYQ